MRASGGNSCEDGLLPTEEWIKASAKEESTKLLYSLEMKDAQSKSQIIRISAVMIPNQLQRTLPTHVIRPIEEEIGALPEWISALIILTDKRRDRNSHAIFPGLGPNDSR